MTVSEIFFKIFFPTLPWVSAKFSYNDYNIIWRLAYFCLSLHRLGAKMYNKPPGAPSYARRM